MVCLRFLTLFSLITKLINFITVKIDYVNKVIIHQIMFFIARLLLAFEVLVQKARDWYQVLIG